MRSPVAATSAVMTVATVPPNRDTEMLNEIDSAPCRMRVGNSAGSVEGIVALKTTSIKPMIMSPPNTVGMVFCRMSSTEGTESTTSAMQPAVITGLRPTRSLMRPMKVITSSITAMTTICST